MLVEKTEIPEFESPGDRRVGLGVPFNDEEHDFVTRPRILGQARSLEEVPSNVSHISSAPSHQVYSFKVAPADSGYDIRTAPESFDGDPNPNGLSKLAIHRGPISKLGKFINTRITQVEAPAGSRVHRVPESRTVIAADNRERIELQADIGSRSSYYSGKVRPR